MVPKKGSNRLSSEPALGNSLDPDSYPKGSWIRIQLHFFFTGAGYEYNVHRYGTEKRGLIRIQRRKASDLARYADRSESGYRTQLLRE